MKKVEILSPAGSYDSLIAAIAAGADAVYIGGEAFGLRAKAHNFTIEDMKEKIAKKDVVIIGGHINWINKLQKQFPKWIIKTDETRIENVPQYLKTTNPWIVTEKLDGTSCTYAVALVKKKKYEFFICSRNQRIIDDKTNIYKKIRHKTRFFGIFP